MIHEVLRRRLLLFRASYQKDPEYVYLGRQEWHELLADHQGTLGRDPEKGKESFMGITIIRVNQENHLNIA